MKRINCILKEENHEYIFESGIKPMKIISGSSFFKKELSEEAKIKAKPYSLAALPLGTGIHKAMENLLNFAYEEKDLSVLYKIGEKYKDGNALFSNILFNTLEILEIEGFSSWEAEKSRAILTEKNVAFCGSADGFLNKRILLDYKSIGFNKYDNLKEMFFVAMQDIFDNKIGRNEHKGYSYYQMIKYVFQFGLYLLIFEADVFYMIIGDKKTMIKVSNLESQILKNIIETKIKEEY